MSLLSEDSNNIDFMPMGIQKRLLQEHLTTLATDAEVSGVLLAGSFARGDAYPGSDLDIYVLLREGADPRPFSAKIREGILVEVSYMDFEKARTKLLQNSMSIYTYRDGRTLQDSEGKLAALRQLADELFITYCVSPSERQGILHWLRSASIKVRAAQEAGDDLKTAYLIATNSFEVMVALWAINDQPLPSGGGILAHLKDLPQQPAQPVDWTQALFQGELPQRAHTFLLVSEWAIAALEEKE